MNETKWVPTTCVRIFFWICGGQIGPEINWKDRYRLASYEKEHICLTSLTRAKCGVRSTLCWKIPNISGSIELFAL